ncbi:MAG: class Ib ribonucleoside-diphosphate reductase assembly flavoprotein NrdI [Symbiopectobacterium sp.]
MVVPSYGGGSSKDTVPHQVIRFLNDDNNRSGLRDVICGRQL